MYNKGADLIFSNLEIMDKAYKIQTLRTLLPLKYAILTIHENEYTYGGYYDRGRTEEDARRAFKNVILSEELEHAVSEIDGQGVSLLVKKELFKKNELGFDDMPTEEFMQWFPSEGIMEWLTGTEENQYGINKSALIQGMMGWEGIETRKAICVDKQNRWLPNPFYIQFGAHYLSNGRPYDPVEDLSSWNLF